MKLTVSKISSTFLREQDLTRAKPIWTAHRCHSMRCLQQSWPRSGASWGSRARLAAKMNQIWSSKSCYVVPSWGFVTWKVVMNSTCETTVSSRPCIFFYLVVVQAVRSSGCMIGCIQLCLWTGEDRAGIIRPEHRQPVPCSMVASTLWHHLKNLFSWKNLS